MVSSYAPDKKRKFEDPKTIKTEEDMESEGLIERNRQLEVEAPLHYYC
jgi:hypothetical protein